jgi:hypothetical protein
MRIPADIELASTKCSVCCSTAVLQCVECIKNGADIPDAPSFCSSACYAKHFVAHRSKGSLGSFSSKRSSSSSGSSSSGPGSPLSSDGSHPPSPLLMGHHPLSPVHYGPYAVHMQPPPPRYAAPAFHRRSIEVGGPQHSHHRTHHRR